MKKMVTNGIIALLLGNLLIGCAQKSQQEHEKPALYWYQKMIHKIAIGNLEKADDLFTSLQSEHIGSPLIGEGMLILAQAHMDAEEYLLAQFYLDEYIKRFGSHTNRMFARFLKIQAAFYGLRSPERDEKLIDDTLKKARRYIKDYPHSPFAPMVQTIETRLEMTRYLLNEQIAALYLRRNKPKAAAIYRNRNSKCWFNINDIQPPQKGWLTWLFQ